MSEPTPLLSMLGPPVLHHGGQETAFAAELRFQLLAYLAQTGDWVARETLAALFWPELPTTRARANLRKLVFRLHQAGPAPPAEQQHGALRWAVTTDGRRFESLLATGAVGDAAALWRGTPWAGLDRGDGGAFDDWLAAERSRLQAHWRDALLRAARTATEPAAALALSRRLLALDPTDEDAVRIGMQAHLALQAPAQARRLYADFEHRLRDEAGIMPGATTQVLLQAAAPRTAGNAAAAADPADDFIGRRGELRELQSRLAKGRWVTLVGPGGCGKSRLAWQALPQLGRALQAQVAWVPLEDLRLAPQILPRVAESLGLPPAGSEPPLQMLALALSGRPLLLALDNLEHLPGAGEVLSALLEAVPALRLLATSREPTRQADEDLLLLQGLPWPPPDAVEDAEDAAAFDAVQLFLRRARRHGAALDLRADAASVCALCRHLAGLPLALELAAAWTRQFSVAEILQDLRHDAALLHDPLGAQQARHRSMALVFEQTWRRLVPAERQVLVRLAVFRGPFGADAARAVAGASVPVLGALLDRCLLDRAPLQGPQAAAGGPAAPIYALHPLTQQFALERLAAQRGAEAAARQAHGQWFLARLRAPIREARQDSRMRNEALAPQSSDVAAAWSYAIQAGQREALAGAALGLARLFEHLGHWDEGVALLEAAGPLLRAEALPRALLDQGLAALHLGAGRLAQADALARSALKTLRRQGGPRAHWGAMAVLGLAARQLGQLQAAWHVFEQLVREAQADGDGSAAAGFLGNAAITARLLGRLDEALALMQRAIAQAETAGDEAELPRLLNNLGNLYRTLERTPEAIQTLQRGLRLVAARPQATLRSHLLCNLALAQFAAGDIDAAQRNAQLAHGAIRDGGQPALAASVDLLLARIAMQSQDAAGALPCIARAAHGSAALGQIITVLDAAAIFGAWLQGQGREAEAQAVFRMVLAHPRCLPLMQPQLQPYLRELPFESTTLEATLLRLRGEAATPPSPA